MLNNENKVIDTINFETDSFTAKIPDFKLSLDEKEIISLQQQLKSYEKLLELEPNNKCRTSSMYKLLKGYTFIN